VDKVLGTKSQHLANKNTSAAISVNEVPPSQAIDQRDVYTKNLEI
jgi:hypothetical protein